MKTLSSDVMEKYRAGNRKIMEKYFHKSEIYSKSTLKILKNGNGILNI